MGIYMTEAKLTKQGILALAEANEDPKEKLDEAMRGIGGRLISYYFAFGPSDVVVIFEAPTQGTSASAVLASVMACTIEDVKTTILMSYEEGVSAFKKVASVGHTPRAR